LNDRPLLIAVAPNGARKTRDDHSALPLTTDELIKTAEDCLDAGASMMHFHVRDSAGRHTLDPDRYRPVLDQLQKVVGDRLLLQVSSEAAGRYQAAEQIELMKRLAPHCLSCGLREIIRDRDNCEAGYSFFSALHRAGVLVQYILYSPEDIRWYETLCKEGVIPGVNHLLLFVLGRYSETKDQYDLQPYISALTGNNPWMVCGFGVNEHKVVTQAVQLGGHVRVGFENNLLLPDGKTAPDNATLVRMAAEKALASKRSIGNKYFAKDLHHGAVMEGG